MKSQIFNLQIFTNAKCRRLTSNDYESIPNGWIVNNIKQAINGIYRYIPWMFCRRLFKCSHSKSNQNSQRFSVLPIEIKSDWKKFIQEFSKNV